MAVLEAVYQVKIKVDEKDVLKLNDFIEQVKSLNGEAELKKIGLAK